MPSSSTSLSGSNVTALSSSFILVKLGQYPTPQSHFSSSLSSRPHMIILDLTGATPVLMRSRILQGAETLSESALLVGSGREVHVEHSLGTDA